jgi:RNA polymerase sigma-70 factor (ECF subfamily)
MSIRERLLIRRLRDRDERAFREMVDQYRDRVYNLTLRMLGNPEEAEDLAQEVFITVFKSIDNFRGDSKLSTWIYRITANHCKNRIKYLARRYDRRKKEFDERIDRESADAGLTAPTRMPRPDAGIEGKELQAALQTAIDSLDEEQRLLVVLRDVEELSYDEICVITELPVGTVKSRIHRARLALRKKLAKYVKKP